MMIRVFVTYRDRDAVLFFVNHHTTIEEVKNKFLGPYPVVFQTTEGQVTIEWGSFEKVYIQEWEHERGIGEVVEIREDKMSDEEAEVTEDPSGAASVQEVDVSTKDAEDNLDASDAAALENSTEQSNVDASSTNVPGEISENPQISGSDSNVSADVSKETKEDKMADTPVLNEKFRSFREKFLSLEADQESWENQIIEKMAKRKEMLQEFANTIDEENTSLQGFKADKVGS